MLSELLADVRYRLRATFRRASVERELRDELNFHLDREIEKQIRAGSPREEAVRQARLAFGGVERIKDDTRDARSVAFVETTLQDVRYAARGLRARPAFTLGIVATLGLGIGANAAMFGVMDRLLFRPPPFMHDAALVHRLYLTTTDAQGERTDHNLPFPLFLDFARSAHAFSAVAAFQTRTLAVGDGDQSREMPVTVASASFFQFFDAHPLVGRFFSASDDRVPTGSDVVVLGHAFWLSRYAGRSDVIGTQLRIGRTLCTVIGVAPKDFVGMSDQGVPAAYMPITTYAFASRLKDYSTSYNWSWLEVIARRESGVSRAAAEADLTAVYRRSWLAQAAAGTELPDIATARPHATLGPPQLGRGPQASRDSRVMAWSGGVAIIVLLIACANVANLLLSRAVGRRHEIALRLALGVSTGRLIRQLLTESLLLGLLGGVVGLVAAQWGGAAIGALLLPPGVSASVVTDWRTLVFTAAVTLAAALLTGLAPALHTSRDDLAVALKAGAREAGGTRRGSRLRKALLVLQATLSVVLLVGAGVFVRSLQNVRDFRLGYDVEPLLYAEDNLRGMKLTPAEGAALTTRMLEAAQSTPGVTHAALTVSVPFWSNEGRALFIEGVDSVRKRGTFLLQAGSPDYFATMGTRVIRGRALDTNDRAGSQPVVVVTEAMARTLWPGRDAIGACMRIGERTAPCTTVVGIAEDARIGSLTDDREFVYYLPIEQYTGAPQGLIARTDGNVDDAVEPLRRRLQSSMPGAAYVSVVPLRALVDPNLRAWRFGATMFLAFGGLALVLAAIGLYSLMSYNVAQRTQEMSVRVALGASIGHIIRLIVLGGLRLVLVGLVLGGAIAYWAAPRIEGIMFHESPRDPLVFGAVALVLIGVALAATIGPALRAAHVDGSAALREE
jgi:putative ABC transport system permease protein